MAGIEGVVFAIPSSAGDIPSEPVGVPPIRMVDLRWRRGFPVPDVEGDYPGVDFKPRPPGDVVSQGQKTAQGIETGADIDGAGFVGAVVIGVTAFADFDEQGVEAGSAGVGDQFAGFGFIAKPGIEGIDPETPEFFGGKIG